MKKLWFYLGTAWQSVLGTIVVSILLASILLFHIGSIPSSGHVNEITTSEHNPSFTSIFNEPVNAPYYGVRNIVRKVRPRPSLAASRAITAGLGFIAVAAFYGLLSLWFRPRVAILGLILFASSSWFLRLARLGLPDILQVLSITLILFWAWLQRTRSPRLAFAVSGIAVAGLLYVPGMVWIIVPAALWRGKYLRKQLGKLSGLLIAGSIILGAMLIAPLMYHVVRQPLNLLDIAGIPRHFNASAVLHNFVSLPVRLVIKGPADPRLTVGRAPILDVFTAAMAVLGLYSSLLSWKLDRNKFTIGLLVLGIIMSTISSDSLLAWLIGPVFLLTASGMAFLLDEWFRVFPSNPLARGIATTLITLAVLFTAFYHSTNYFIAWPNAPTTRTAFTYHL